MKKILLISTGGTFGMAPLNEPGSLATSESNTDILGQIPELAKLAEITCIALFNIDSTNLQVGHWQQLGRAIYSRYTEYDGFVIVHGTDAMTYTASALSYILSGLGKPVVLTGAVRPLTCVGSDARNNVIYAVEMALREISEVVIFFGRRLFRGNRAVKINAGGFDAFTSPNYPQLFEAGHRATSLGASALALRPPRSRVIELRERFDDRVFCFRFHPGLDPKCLEYLVASDFKAVVVEALGLGSVAYEDRSLLPWIERMTNAGKLVVLASQSMYGGIDLACYEFQKRLRSAGALSAGDMTIDATIVKLMFLLGQYPDDPKKVEELIGTSIAGEISEDRETLRATTLN
ncbi:MAG TPA: asparaginase [Terriglobales bacterium]|nr:asparaginase [Terriglobales bacterium]